MSNFNAGEQRLNKFVLISVVLHAIALFAFPNLDSLFKSEVPGMAGGGVVHIVDFDSGTNTRNSPTVDPLAQALVPRVSEPRPINEPEEVKVPEIEEAPTASVEREEVEVPLVERAKPQVTEPLVPEPPQEIVEEVVEVETETEAEIITSDFGREVVVDVAEEEAILKPPTEKRPEPPVEEVIDTSGSETGTVGSDDVSGESESGEGEAEEVPPPPAPPTSGRTLVAGGGKPLYPKNAENDEVEGTVSLLIEVLASGELQKIEVIQSSGDARLDLQALRHIEHLWTFQKLDYDYSMEIDVIYSRVDNRFDSSLNYGAVKWLNLP